MTGVSERLDAIEARRDPDGCAAHKDCLRSDVAYLLDLARKQQAALDAVEEWCGRNRTGFYDEAQDDATAIIHEALEGK